MKSLKAKLLLIITFTSILLFSQILEANSQVSVTEISNSEVSDNIKIEINQNVDSLGLDSEIDFTINVTNVCPEDLYNIEINVSTSSEDVNISSNYLSQAVLNVQEEITFHSYANIINPEITSASSVDLVLCIDSSGSMGEEIESVQDELNKIITTLDEEIPDIRIGAIAYGWALHSEYPMSSTSNYIPLTTDFGNLKEFINSLYASGGIEPWGDALYLADTWEWREEANKLIIMVGDEDCDPGKIVGSESSSSVYNGTELFAVVDSLKQKGIIINSVVTENPDQNVEDQFQWISNYTQGESVYLPEIESAADPMTLPELIQEWTLELSREFSHWITVDVYWTNIYGNEFYNTAKAHFWLDLAPPSILHFETIKSAKNGFYNVEIIAEVRDFSNITNVVIYHNAMGTWTVENMDYNTENLVYTKTLLELPLNYNLTFFIEAADINGNAGSSMKYWLLVMPSERQIGELSYLFLSSEECEETLFSPIENCEHYLWIKSNNNEVFNLSVLSGTETIDILHPDEIKELDNFENGTSLLLYKFNMRNESYRLLISAEDNISQTLSVEYCWLKSNNLNSRSVDATMTEQIRKTLYLWDINEWGYLYIDYTPSSDLVVIGDVYFENWTYIGSITVSNSVNLTSGKYYVIIHGTLRTGNYRVIINDERPEVDDWYYSYSGTNASGFEFIIFPFVFLLLSLKSFRKRKKIQ